MVESLNLVLLAALWGATSSTLTDALHGYFHYVRSLFWRSLIDWFDMHYIEFYQTRLNTHVSAIFDQMGMDTRCRMFKHNDLSWSDGAQHKYQFLVTPSWTAYFLQLFMLGYWVLLPANRDHEHVTMLVHKDTAQALVEVVNGMDSGQCLSDDNMALLKDVFATDQESKGLAYIWSRISSIILWCFEV